MESILNKPVVEVRDLGTVDYRTAWDLQENLFNAVIARKLRYRSNPALKSEQLNYLLFCEHPNVYTLGKSGSMNNLRANQEVLNEKQISFFKTNRGGDITYHGPGQIVGYPILDLDLFFTDIGKYLRYIEETIIRTLAEYGVVAGRSKGQTGVWLDVESPSKARKICAIGVRCSRWVTMHGFAFNVNTNLDYFNHIIPCGIADKSVTSLQKEIGTEVDMNEVKNKLLHHFSELFEATIKETVNQKQTA